MSLRKKLDALVEQTSKPVFIFDLDGTLFDVIYRTMEIMKRFTAQSDIRERFAEQLGIVEKLRHQDFLYSLEQTLNSIGIDRYSEHAAHFLHAAETFWFKHFFTDELVLADQPYAGAAECVKHYHKQGAQIVYLSGRDVPNMSRGTIECLERHGFPHTGHGVTICLKPAYGQDDLLFKKQSLETIAQLGTVVATFDNEPANVQMFIDHYPKGLHFHFNTQYARKLELKGAGLNVIKSFTELEFGS